MDLPIQFLKLPIILVLVVAFTGCGISPNLTSTLESDELYLSSNEEFITDAEYLAFALNNLEKPDSDYNYSGDDYYYNNSGNSNIGYNNHSYLPNNSLGLSPFFSSYGAGYSNYNYGGNNGFGYGYSPYGSNNYGYGYNPYNNYGYGYNPYNNYGYGNYGTYGGGSYGGYGNYSGGDTYYTSSILVGARTPLLSGTLTNSNYYGGRLRTNRTEEAGSGEINSTNIGSDNNPARKTDTRPAINDNSTRSDFFNRSDNMNTPSKRSNTRPENNNSRSNNSVRSTNSTGGRSGGRRP